MPNLIIRFIDSAKLVAIAIDFVEGGAGLVDHAEICTDTGTWIGAHAKDGVQERAADYCKPRFELRYALPVTEDQHAKILGFMRAQIGKPYDFTGIMGILFHESWHDPKAWFCSELVCAACEAGGIFMLNVLPGYTFRITPEMLHLSPLLIGHLAYRDPELKHAN